MDWSSGFFALTTLAFWLGLTELSRWRLKRVLKRERDASPATLSPTEFRKLMSLLRERIGVPASIALLGRIVFTDGTATTLEVERKQGQVECHCAISHADPLADRMFDLKIEAHHPFWFVVAHEAAHVRNGDVVGLRLLGIGFFVVGLLVSAFSNAWWAAFATYLLRWIWNMESRRRERRADREGWTSETKIDESLARGAYDYFVEQRKQNLKVRERIPLGRWWIAPNGDCRIDFLHPPLSERISRAASVLENEASPFYRDDS